ncbi:hypothetical protein DUNSADRAFT_7518 [Dunaliella salina]|uniref:Peptidase S54 rhomboid domain-containing protein n=1 Tax=Dunaliella salina TaxID=3046 RepID=A0ABQ7GL64_DUNSA|nr:hypothetical protein DUNSADRAFT_7518 [Dunaliella salina]|eukprot:KAF5835352.1 hypothetical protein DUNSADRAFT_7518 [Dunaliella salina]
MQLSTKTLSSVAAPASGVHRKHGQIFLEKSTPVFHRRGLDEKVLSVGIQGRSWDRACPKQTAVCAGRADLVQRGEKKPAGAGNGVYLLMLINAILFLCDQVFHLPMMRSLCLSHAHPHWWQWVTHTFMHASWGHISNNMFFLLTFGRLVEDTEGAFGVVFTYLVCGMGAAFASYLLSPANTVSVGASGAIFGLFAVSVLSRLQLNLRSLLESLVLGQFVMTQVLSELKSQMRGGLTLAGGLQVSHLAHLGGALAGVLLVLLLQRLPAGDEE